MYSIQPTLSYEIPQWRKMEELQCFDWLEGHVIGRSWIIAVMHVSAA